MITSPLILILKITLSTFSIITSGFSNTIGLNSKKIKYLLKTENIKKLDKFKKLKAKANKVFRINIFILKAKVMFI